MQNVIAYLLFPSYMHSSTLYRQSQKLETKLPLVLPAVNESSKNKHYGIHNMDLTLDVMDDIGFYDDGHVESTIFGFVIYAYPEGIIKY